VFEGTTRPAPSVGAIGHQTPRALQESIAVRGGVRLAGDVYLPLGDTRRWPTILIRTPYDKTGRYTYLPQVAERFAAAGFAVVVQDVRGKYRSEGALEPFVHEAQDGVDTADWIVAQPWSDGTIGTWGESYYGFTQWALASRRHPAHRAMVPRVTGPSFFDMRSSGGIPPVPLLGWLAETWTRRTTVERHAYDATVIPLCDMVNPALPGGSSLLRQFIDVAAEPSGLFNRVYPAGDPAHALSIPALHVGGWFDLLKAGQLDAFARSLESPAAEHQYLRMSTTDHEGYDWLAAGEVRGPDFADDDDALAGHADDLVQESIDFFRHYLGNHDGRWAAPRVRYSIAGGSTKDSTTWPPSGSSARTLYLAPGQLTESVPTPGELSWTHDPADPTPFLASSAWDPNRNGLPDERSWLDRNDVSTFAGAPIDSAEILTGRTTLHVDLRAATTRTHIVARLYDVDSEHVARLVVANAIDVPAEGDAFFRATVELGDIAYRLGEGHRLVLGLATSLAGMYPIHPGTDDDPWVAVERVPSTQQLRLGASRLVIHVEPDADWGRNA
jgi:putative CocE/NonD family hydrolase